MDIYPASVPDLERGAFRAVEQTGIDARVLVNSDRPVIACLGGEQLKRIETDGDKVVHQEIVFKGLGRVRDVVTGPDGLLYLAMNTPGRIARLVPDDGSAPAAAAAPRQLTPAPLKP